MRGATSTPSSGADEALCSTTGRANFQRVTRLLISGGTRLLRDTFDFIYTPSILPVKLNDPAVQHALKTARLTKPQWECLYPSPGVYGKSTDFDITLLFRLLRTICLLSPPSTGWDDLPKRADHSLTADLVRVKCYRNSVYGHVKENMEIENSNFQRLWKEIKEPLLRIADNISTAKRDEWQKAIESFSKDPLTPEDERCVEELTRWYRNDLDVKKAIEELKATQEGACRLGREIVEGVKETSQVVETAVRDIKEQIGHVQESMDRLSSSVSGTQTAGARLRLRIDCEAITEVGTESGAPPELAVTLQQHQDESHEQPLAPVIIGQPIATEARVAPERKRGCPSEQEVLNLVVLRYLNNDELSSPSAFLQYLTDVRKLLVLDVEQGSLLITVECGSLQILDELWEDYLSGHLNRMVQELLVTADILKELGLIEAKFVMKTTILEEDYRACREHFLHTSGGKPNVQKKQEGQGRGAPRKESGKSDVPGSSKVKGSFSGNGDGKPNVQKKQEGGGRRAPRQDKTEDVPGSSKVKGNFSGNSNKGKRTPDKVFSRQTGQSCPTPKNQQTQHKVQPSRRRQNNEKRKYSPKKCPELDHGVLKTLREKDSMEVVNRLNESIFRLKYLLRSQEVGHSSDEFVFDLICVLAKACDAPATESTNKILVALKGSVFLNVKIPILLDRVQAETTLIDQESCTKLLQALIEIFFKYLRHLPSSYADLPREQVQRALDQLNIESKGELQKQLDAFKQERDEVIREERQRHGKRFKERKGEKPPNDFREIPVCPTNKEVVAHERPFLRKNITKGRYEDTEHYLDVQFRLLREDFLEPLREGIYEMTHNIPRHQCNQMMKRYNGVHIVGKELTMSGITYKVQFDVSRLGATRWAHSRRLIYGSFLCLSNDNFQTMLFATVANRDPDELKKGRFDVRFIEEPDIFGIEKRRNEYLMVESPAYFEAYRHVLKGLKELDDDNLPFKKYLVECSADVDPPEYIRREEDEEAAYYDLSKALADTVKLRRTLGAVPILQPEAWPSAKDLSLNNSQLEALKTALTTEFSVIQGPPGTGKTYVGAKIVQCLLENRRQWDPEHISPMLMVCYTNHALDQFLEKVTDFLPKERIIRVGGRCKSEHLEGCNVKRFVGRYRMNTKRREIEDKIRENEQQIRKSQGKLKQINSDKMILEFDDLVDFINEGHVEQLVDAIFPANAENECRRVANTFKLWLCDNQKLRNCNKRSKAGKERAEKERHDGSILQHEETYDGVTENDIFYDASESQTWLDDRGKGCQLDLEIPDDQRTEELFNYGSNAGLNNSHSSSPNEIAMECVDEMSILRPVESNESQDGIRDVATTDVNDNRAGSCLSAEASMVNSFGLDIKATRSILSSSTTKKGGVFVQQSGLQPGSVEFTEQLENRCSSSMSFSKIKEMANMEQEETQMPTLDLKATHDLPSKLLGISEADDEEGQEKLSEPYGETITVEEEADLIRFQRCIEGEEKNFHPLRLMQLNEDKSEEPGHGNLSCDKDEGWISVRYSGKPSPFIWQQGTRNTSKDEITEVLAVDTERGNDPTETSSRFQNDSTSKKDGVYFQPSGVQGECVQFSDQLGSQSSSHMSFSQTKDANQVTNMEQKEAQMPAQFLEEIQDSPSKLLGIGEADDEECKEKLSKPDGETITVEEEADLIRFQRCIDGEEDNFLPLRLKQVDEGNSDDLSQRKLSCDTDKEWTTVKYSKKSTPFIWQQRAINTSKDEITDVHPVATEQRNDTSLPQTSNRRRNRKKNKKKKVKIEITKDDISRVQEELMNENAMTANEAAGVDNVWLLSSSDRLRMYSYWLECYHGRYKMEIQRGEQGHDQLCFQLEAIRAEEEEQVLRRATVVGMTTSCAARYHSTLQRIAPKIVVIEEAAEVMEAHILTSLSRDTEHTILIGDHKQLRPKATVYELAQKYNLEISLFERMVTNKMDCKRLSIQHRMRPEIAELTKRIYDHEIVDHESVCQFNDISGVGHNLFFINHCQPERLMGGLQSYCNCHEAEFLVAFCNYLLLQGYKPEQITILTMYTGQLLDLREKMPKRKFEGVKVCAVDNFQGEENDIILLSLVRSNTEGRVGFVKDSNRICVALSRARQGFYCIGNFNLLSSECKLWKEICDDMTTKKAMGETLQLVCKRHQNVNEVRSSNDFKRVPNGGCGKPCEDRLNCGHACDRSCHPIDLKHREYQCRKLCLQSCPNEHQCQLVCHYPDNCEPCSHLLTKTIPLCGHKQTVQCSTDAATFVCLAKCEKVLECGHNCNTFCGRRCTQNCQVQCDKELPCGHKKILPCCLDPAFFLCDENCIKILECGHPCSLKCKEPCQCTASVEVELSCKHPVRILCREKDHPPKCSFKCQRSLDCGHRCPRICSQECSLFKCKVLVKKALPCGHKRNLPCYRDPEDVECKASCQQPLDCGHQCPNICHGGVPCQQSHCSKMIIATLECDHEQLVRCGDYPSNVKCHEKCNKECKGGHPCQKQCHVDSECEDCNVIVSKTIPTCKHNAEVPCHIDVSTVQCGMPCERFKDCEHPCSGICCEDCATRPCTTPVIRTLQCTHNVVLPCHSNPEEHRCEEKVEVDLLCGHKKPMICSTLASGKWDETCDVKELRVLPCKHTATLPCHKNPEEHKCKEKVEVKLGCGHMKVVNCSNVTAGSQVESCDVRVLKQLPCKHKMKLKCSENEDKVLCKAPCKKPLSCGHPCPGTCNDDCSNFKCQKKCARKLRCGHPCPGKCFAECSQYQCKKMVQKKLPCTGKHQYQMRCCDDPKTIVCKELCKKNLDCGHQCPGLCSEDCRRMKCLQRIEKTFSCGHRQALSCFETKTAICQDRCVRRKVSCKHVCSGLCGEPCSKYPCKVRLVKTLPCGHRIEMLCSHNPNNVRCPARCGIKLQCGHLCSGTCSDCKQRGSHELCRHPCGRLLVCSHRCGATCSEPCPPCDKQCRRRCPHGRCTRRCSDPCKPCQLPCTWSCPHGQCNNLCGESCDRLPCNAPCSNRLLCGHPCIGLCGENCPTACRVCHAKQLSSMLVDQRGNKDDFAKFLQLFDCGHVKKVAEMDAWMQHDMGPDVQYRRCPECPTPITFSYRYGNHIKRTLEGIENVKTQAKQLADETFSSTTNLARDLRSFTPHLPKLNFPWQLDFLSDQERRPLLPRFRDRDVLFLFTLKNQLQILCEIQRTQHVLQSASKERKRWPAGDQTSQRSLEIEELSSVATSALEQMTEFLQEPQLDLKTLCQLYEHTRKFSLFSRLLEAENQAMKHSQTPLSTIGKTRLKNAHERFMVFLQGNNDALGLEWLQKIVNSLRKEVRLPALPEEEAKDFENFPGFTRGVWKLCGQGHVYVTRLVVRSGTDLPLYIGECHRCGIMENDLEEYEIELEDE